MADSWFYRADKWVRRSPVTAGLALAVLLALVGGLGATTLAARRAEREAERANAEAARAQTEAERAGREAAAAHQVSRFLEDLFAATTPSAAKGREVSARELLDAGVERIDAELADQPQVRARLLHAMGAAYQHIGRFESAQLLLERALAEREASQASPLDLAATHMALADLFVEIQRPEDAEPHVSAAIAHYEAAGDATGRPLVEALGKLGMVLNRQMKLEGAETALIRASRLYDQLPEPDDELAARLELALASLYADQGKPALALAALERVLVVARRSYGVDHVRTVVALNNVGQARIEIGRPAEAEPPLHEALVVARKILEPNHPLLGTVLRNLGGSLARQTRLDEAEPLLQEALSNHAAAYGEKHFLSQLASTSLGIVRLRQGRLDEARRRFSQALVAIEPVFGADHLVVSELHHLLGETQRARGDHDQARRSFEHALAIRERIFGADGSATRETATALAELGR